MNVVIFRFRYNYGDEAPLDQARIAKPALERIDEVRAFYIQYTGSGYQNDPQIIARQPIGHLPGRLAQ